jgi:hypothetical protein
MGIFKEVKNMEATLGSAADPADAPSAAPPADSVDARARVLSIGPTSGMLDDDPIVPLELMVFEPGGIPRPVSTSVVVPLTQLHRLAPGATMPVKLSASDPDALALDWSAPA